MQRGAWCNSQLKMQALHSVQRNLRNHVLSRPQAKSEGERLRGDDHRVSPGQGRMVQKAQSKSTDETSFSLSPEAQGADTNVVQYLGIAADEPERIKRHKEKPGIVLPLVDIGWDEAYCRKWCEENGLLSPIYTDSSRGGCWFCHNQGVDQLRLLRHQYPEYWSILLKWDWDSPVKFRPNGTTVHDYDLRFAAEDLNLVPKDRKFRWKMLEDPKLYKGDH